MIGLASGNEHEGRLDITRKRKKKVDGLSSLAFQYSDRSAEQGFLHIRDMFGGKTHKALFGRLVL